MFHKTIHLGTLRAETALLLGHRRPQRRFGDLAGRRDLLSPTNIETVSLYTSDSSTISPIASRRRNPASMPPRIGARSRERRVVVFGVPAVEQTSFNSTRTTSGTTAMIPDRLMYAQTAGTIMAQQVQAPGAGRVVRIPFAAGVGGGGAAGAA